LKTPVRIQNLGPALSAPERAPIQFQPPNERDELRLRELGLTLVRNRWVVLAVAALVVALTALYTFRQPKIYLTEATLRVEDRDQNQQILSQLAPTVGFRPGKIETEMAVLRSRQIREQVADTLRLMLQMVDPETPRDRTIRALVMPHDAETGEWELRRTGDRQYSLHATDERAQRVAAPRQVLIGRPFRVGKASLALAPELATRQVERIRFAIVPYRNAVSGLRASLSVVRPDPLAYIVAVRFEHTDPELAASIVNALSTAFMDYKSGTSKAEARSTVNFLRSQVAAYERQLGDVESQLRDFRERRQVVNLQEEAAQHVQRLAQLQAEHDGLSREREVLTRLLSIVERPAAGTAPSPYRQLASFPVFLSNRAVQDLLQSLTALENQRATLLVRRTAANEEVQSVNQRIGEIELQLYQIARGYLQTLNTQISSSQATLGRFSAQLEQIPSREVEFARRSREQVLLADLYTLLQTRLKEAEIREAVQPGDVRVVDPALVPLSPISPKPMRSMALAAIVGLFFGICVAFAREALDTKIRTRDDLADATGDAPVLAMIPRIRTSSSGLGRGATGVAALEERLVTRLSPHSPAAEAYRSLRTNITFASLERSPQVLVVTSALPGDGKTTSAANLAITLAQQGTRTLLVDSDLRRGVMHKVLAAHQAPGLTHVLMGTLPLAEAVQEISAGDDGVTLHFLPSGAFPPNPAELLGSARMRTLLDEMRSQYEMVVFDAAPLNLVTDAAVLGTAADTTLLVARFGLTDRRALHRAAAQIYQLGAPLAGVILNDVDADGDSRYYGYGYSYGYAPLEGSTNGNHDSVKKKRKPR
jgi:capsular exopolysaccharide synthesis family protein